MERDEAVERAATREAQIWLGDRIDEYERGDMAAFDSALASASRATLMRAVRVNVARIVLASVEPSEELITGDGEYRQSRTIPGVLSERALRAQAERDNPMQVDRGEFGDPRG